MRATAVLLLLAAPASVPVGGPVAERCGGSGQVSRFRGRPRRRGVPSPRGSRKPRPMGSIALLGLLQMIAGSRPVRPERPR